MMKKNTTDLTAAAVCMALAQLLPLVTGQIPQLGAMLLPMHLAVIICGFLCTPFYAALVGFTAPLLRFAIFGIPILFPTGIAMSFELMTYALVVSLMRKKYSTYPSLLTAMLIGRIVWGTVMTVIAGLSSVEFGFSIFIAGAFVTALPGIIIQIVLVPVLLKIIRSRGLDDSKVFKIDQNDR